MINVAQNTIIKETKTGNTVAVSIKDSYFNFKRDWLIIGYCEIVISLKDFNDMLINDPDFEVYALISNKPTIVYGKIVSVVGGNKYRTIDIQVKRISQV